MKLRTFVFSAALTLAMATGAMAQSVYVDPYNRRDGTHVDGYYRTAPDHNLQNNFSTQGNVNPFTGQSGTVNPYNFPQPAPVYPSNPYQQRRW
jgi:hypothetical protein